MEANPTLAENGAAWGWMLSTHLFSVGSLGLEKTSVVANHQPITNPYAHYTTSLNPMCDVLDGDWDVG